MANGRLQFGAITHFCDYSTQDHEWHKSLDVSTFPVSKIEDPWQKAAAEMAIQRSTELLNMLKARVPENVVRKWLREGPFKLGKNCCNDASPKKSPCNNGAIPIRPGVYKLVPAGVPSGAIPAEVADDILRGLRR